MAEITRRKLLGAAALTAGAAALPANAASAATPQTADAPTTTPERAAWNAFCDRLRDLGAQLEAPGVPDYPGARAEGLRALGRLVALGLDRFVEFADTAHPGFYDLQTAVRKYLGDNPDQTYRVAEIDGRGRYRIRGNARGAAGVEIGVYAGTFNKGEAKQARRLVAMVDEGKLALDAGGGFDVFLSPDASEHPDVVLAPDSNSVLIRTYFWDRALREAHTMPHIVRTDVATAAPMPDLERVARGMQAAAAFVDGSLDFWRAWCNRLRALPPNQFEVMPDDGTLQTPDGVRYLQGWVMLDAGQQLELTIDPKDAPAYWNLVLQNAWGETPDWRTHPIARNNRELKPGDDGRVRVVVAHTDPKRPGVHWLDMAGRRELLLALRWRGKSALPKVETTTRGAASNGPRSR